MIRLHTNPRGTQWLAQAAVAGLAVLLGVAWLPGEALADPGLAWHDLYDGGVDQDDFGQAALTDPAGNLVVAGESTDGTPGIDLLVRKLARDTGVELWSRRVPAADGNDMQLGGIAWDGYGRLLVAGTRLGCFG